MATDSEGPSPDEVRRYVDRLYDRAESDTGTFNATRAAAIPRQRDTAARGRSQSDAEPAGGTLARKWFDAARAKLGPTVPAWHTGQKVPAGPDRAPQGARPVRQAERPAEPRALEAPRTSSGAAFDRTPTGAALELTSGSAQAPVTEFLPELPDRRAAPATEAEPRQDERAWRAGAPSALDADMAAWPLYEPSSAPAPQLGPQSAGALLTVPEPTAALPTIPAPTTTLPTIPAPTTALPADLASTAGAQRADVPANGAEMYGAGQPAVATAPYATAPAADPTAYYASGPQAEVSTAAYGAGLPGIPASALTAPAPPVPTGQVPALAPTAPSVAAAPFVPDIPTPRGTPSAPYASGAYGGSWLSPDQGHSTRTERVIAFARAQMGRPCVWGAVGPGSYDAPGLTQAAWKTAGVTLPRTSQTQWGAGVHVSLADAQVGDLVFFHDDLGHVGIWSGDGMMIHAPGPGALIREESVFFAGRSAVKGVIRPA
ncbi:NlpC/P60 family protein [Streptomyces sp. NPDC056373]|uniref:NlpC/P60 family protein n=1 Tax=Streptomyces sp. NPDC056373 TaxID=3345798 RepID=UPI0035DADC42